MFITVLKDYAIIGVAVSSPGETKKHHVINKVGAHVYHFCVHDHYITEISNDSEEVKKHINKIDHGKISITSNNFPPFEYDLPTFKNFNCTKDIHTFSKTSNIMEFLPVFMAAPNDDAAVSALVAAKILLTNQDNEELMAIASMMIAYYHNTYFHEGRFVGEHPSDPVTILVGKLQVMFETNNKIENMEIYSKIINGLNKAAGVPRGDTKEGVSTIENLKDILYGDYTHKEPDIFSILSCIDEGLGIDFVTYNLSTNGSTMQVFNNSAEFEGYLKENFTDVELLGMFFPEYEESIPSDL